MRTRLLALLLSASMALIACATEDKETEDDETTDTDTDTDAGSGDTDTDTDDAPDCVEGLLEGDCAPDFTLPDADGTDRTLSDFAGQRVVIIGTAEW